MGLLSVVASLLGAMGMRNASRRGAQAVNEHANAVRELAKNHGKLAEEALQFNLRFKELILAAIEISNNAGIQIDGWQRSWQQLLREIQTNGEDFLFELEERMARRLSYFTFNFILPLCITFLLTIGFVNPFVKAELSGDTNVASSMTHIFKGYAHTMWQEGVSVQLQIPPLSALIPFIFLFMAVFCCFFIVWNLHVTAKCMDLVASKNKIELEELEEKFSGRRPRYHALNNAPLTGLQGLRLHEQDRHVVENLPIQLPQSVVSIKIRVFEYFWNGQNSYLYGKFEFYQEGKNVEGQHSVDSSYTQHYNVHANSFYRHFEIPWDGSPDASQRLVTNISQTYNTGGDNNYYNAYLEGYYTFGEE